MQVRAFERYIPLKQWQHRKLALMGKLTVIKNSALPKLIYALSALLNPTDQTVKRIEKLKYEIVDPKKLRELYSRGVMKTEV